MASLLVLLLTALATVAASATSCIDEDGKAVDWWFIYKMPGGFRYSYRDARTTTTGLHILSDRFLNMTTGLALGDTLHQVYAAKTTLAYVLYNDEAPKTYAAPVPVGNTSEDETAHAKGVLAFDGSSGFWLIHSVPKFPDLSAPSFEWSASTVFGQSFLCISLDTANVDVAAFQLRHMEPGIIASNMPNNLATAAPNLTAAVHQERISATSSIMPLTSSVSGVHFTHYGKGPTWGKDLYEDLVEADLKQPFFWETWRRNPYTEASFCTQDGHAYDSVNVMSISFGPNEEDQFKYTRDHCKWGVSQTGSWVCVGDINRMTSQRHRGGGAACFQNQLLHDAIQAVVATTEPCSGPSPSPPSPTPPTPTPPAPPSPTPPTPAGQCCYVHTSTCSVGDVCCTSSGTSYSSASTCSRYGKAHGCQWTGSQCVVGPGRR